MLFQARALNTSISPPTFQLVTFLNSAVSFYNEISDMAKLYKDNYMLGGLVQAEQWVQMSMAIDSELQNMLARPFNIARFVCVICLHFTMNV